MEPTIFLQIVNYIAGFTFLGGSYCGEQQQPHDFQPRHHKFQQHHQKAFQIIRSSRCRRNSGQSFLVWHFILLCSDLLENPIWRRLMVLFFSGYSVLVCCTPCWVVHTGWSPLGDCLLNLDKMLLHTCFALHVHIY